MVLTAVAPSSGVGFILSIGTVSRPITQLIHRDTQARGRTGPFTWVTLPRYIICRQNKFCLCRLTHSKGKSENRAAESYPDIRLLRMKRYEVCEVCMQPYLPRNVLLILWKLWPGLYCQGNYCHFKSMQGIGALRGSHGGSEGFCSPSSKNTHSSQPCGGILKPFGGAAWSCATKRHLNNTLNGAQA